MVDNPALLWLIRSINLGFERTCTMPALQIINHKPGCDGLPVPRNAFRALGRGFYAELS
jgi:hypothetical protein